MAAKRTQSQSRRRLSASSQARRDKRAAARRRNTALAVSGAVTIVLAAPLSIAAYMGVESSLPGFEAAKSFLAMMADRSPGDRTKGELIKTKQKAPAPEQRALGKITKPETPKEFLEAIAPPAPKLDEPAQFAPVLSGLGPLLVTPPPGGGGGILFPPSPPGGGGGGPNPPPPEQPPPPPPPPEQPPPAVPEPGTWATMLLGFGLTGWMLRRRRRPVAAIVSG